MRPPIRLLRRWNPTPTEECGQKPHVEFELTRTASVRSIAAEFVQNHNEGEQMNRSTKIIVCWLGALLVATAAFSQSATGKNPLQGVWKVTELTATGANASTIKNAQPGFYIFTGKYYSISVVTADKPRADLPQDVNTTTAAQIRDAWGPFTGQAGTYEVKGSEVTRSEEHT